MMIDEALTRRELPDPFTAPDGRRILDVQQWETSRETIKELLCRCQYGMLPPAPDSISFDLLETDGNIFAAGGIYQKIMITLSINGGRFSFPVNYIRPKTPGRHKTIVHINARSDVPDRYLPCEEINDNGFAVASFDNKSVSSDDGDFSDGLAGILYKNGRRGNSDAGKIMIWAWAAMRVMDFLQTQDCVDRDNIAVTGHSRLGKTALVAAAYDERFAFVHSNNSGCCGAAIGRQKIGESVGAIWDRFPYWFCENFGKYGDDENAMPFDQHYLLALIAPRYISVGSAEQDSWADPVSEYLCCAAASPAYAFYDKRGFVAPDRLPVAGDVFFEGSVGYYLRSGSHYFGRYDCRRMMEFINSR